MEMSVVQTAKDVVNFQDINVASIEELAHVVKTTHYALGTFKNGYRNKANFIATKAIALDIDEGMTLEEAEMEFAEYMHIIAPSRSHLIEKNGVVADRFRVILFLTEPITDCETFEATWHTLAAKWPAIDHACKDASRFYYASKSVYSLKPTGLTIEPVKPKPVEKKERAVSYIFPGTRGELGAETKKFLATGEQTGGRNRATFKAAKDFQQALYTHDETLERILMALDENGTIASDFTEAEITTTVRSAFNVDPKHEPRIKPNAFKLQTIGQMYKDKTEVDWVVDELLMVGGLSIISADPKAGKSTVARQLVRDILRGGTFFGRKCRKGAAMYFGMEEHTQVLNKSFTRLGITEADDLLVHVGDVLTDEVFQDFREIIIERKPTLTVVDTMLDLVQVENENSYSEMKTKLRKIRQIARDSGTHILLIHHTNKSSGDQDKRRGNQRILGSQAISGAMDAIIVIELNGKERSITTSGREVKQWYRQPLEFDYPTFQYTLGVKKQDEY